jgi:hypothetical protein
MRTKSFFRLLSIGLAAALTLSLSPAQVQAKQPGGEELVLWELKQTKITDPGKTVNVPPDKKTGFPGGVLTTGFTIEAKAKSKSDLLVPEGTFRLTLSAFSPAADMPAQRAGFWYIQGKWTLVDKNADKAADKKAAKARHNLYTMEGRVHSALPFNPALEQGRNMSMKASVPMSPAAGQWVRGKKGVLTLNAGLEGEIQLPLTLGPEIR